MNEAKPSSTPIVLQTKENEQETKKNLFTYRVAVGSLMFV